MEGVREQEDSVVVILRDGEEKMDFFFPPNGGAPRSIGVLRPGRPFRLETVNGKAQLARGSQIFVPVDPRAEQALQTFKENLEYLPPDMESLVWHALRRPSLDARIDRLETKIFGQTAIQEQERAGWVRRMETWFQKPNVRWSLAGFVLAALLIVGLYATRDLILGSGKSKTETKETPKKDEPPIQEPARETKPEEASGEQVFAKKVGAVLKAIDPEGKTPKFTAVVTSLYKTHFKDFVGKDDNEILDLLKEHSADRNLLVHGLIKLDLLALDPNAPDIGYIGQDNLSATKKVLKGKGISKESRDLLACLACRYGEDSADKTPTLPQTEATSGYLGSIDIAPGKTCAKLSLKDATPELERIESYLGKKARVEDSAP